MIRILAILFFICLLVQINAYSQNKSSKPINTERIDKYDVDNNCDEGGQQEMNYCLSEAEKKLLKIMLTKYKCLIAYFDSQINEYASPKDSAILADVLKQKKYLISSQKAWKKLADQNAAYWNIGGGTITPMYVAQSFIKDIKDRLYWLDNIIEEEGQGDEVEVLKCQ